MYDSSFLSIWQCNLFRTATIRVSLWKRRYRNLSVILTWSFWPTHTFSSHHLIQTFKIHRAKALKGHAVSHCEKKAPLKVLCYLYQFKGQTSGTLRRAAVWFIFISEPHQTLRPRIYCQTPQGHQNVNNWLTNKTPHFPPKYHHICHFKSIDIASHISRVIAGLRRKSRGNKLIANTAVLKLLQEMKETDQTKYVICKGSNDCRQVSV